MQIHHGDKDDNDKRDWPESNWNRKK